MGTCRHAAELRCDLIGYGTDRTLRHDLTAALMRCSSTRAALTRPDPSSFIPFMLRMNFRPPALRQPSLHQVGFPTPLGNVKQGLRTLRSTQNIPKCTGELISTAQVVLNRAAVSA